MLGEEDEKGHDWSRLWSELIDRLVKDKKLVKQKAEGPTTFTSYAANALSFPILSIESVGVLT